MNDNTLWCMRVACWISKVTRTHIYTPTLTYPGTRTHTHTRTKKYVILIFSCNNGFANSPQGYVMSTLPVLFLYCTVNITRGYLTLCVIYESFLFKISTHVLVIMPQVVLQLSVSCAKFGEVPQVIPRQFFFPRVCFSNSSFTNRPVVSAIKGLVSQIKNE
jgi:hypothetical protein